MSRNVKLQIFVDGKVYNKILNYREKNHCKSESQAVYRIISEYEPKKIDELTGEEVLPENVQRNFENLNKIIQGKEERIKQLEYAIRHIYGKEFKELKKDD